MSIQSIRSSDIEATVTPGPQSKDEAGAERVGRRASAWLAWTLWALYLIAVYFSTYLVWVNNPQAFVERIPGSLLSYALSGLLPITFGALIVSRHPENPLGLIFCLFGLSQITYLLAQQYTVYSLRTASGSLPGTTVAMSLATQWPTYLTVNLFASFVLLLFPTGRLPSPRWRPVAWLAGGLTVLYTAITALRPARLELGVDGLVAYNPLGIPGTEKLFGALDTIAGILYTFVVIAAVWSVVLRYRRAQDEERQQIKWFVYAAALFLPALVLSFAVGLLVPELRLASASSLLPILDFIVQASWLAAFSAVPLAVGIAILKYRLYDIDLIINRTLVYVPLTGIVAGLFAASIALFQRLAQALTGETSDTAIIISALILASLFTPIKNGLQAVVDKYFKENPQYNQATRCLWRASNCVRTNERPITTCSPVAR